MLSFAVLDWFDVWDGPRKAILHNLIHTSWPPKATYWGHDMLQGQNGQLVAISVQHLEETRPARRNHETLNFWVPTWGPPDANLLVLKSEQQILAAWILKVWKSIKHLLLTDLTSKNPQVAVTVATSHALLVWSALISGTLAEAVPWQLLAFSEGIWLYINTNLLYHWRPRLCGSLWWFWCFSHSRFPPFYFWSLPKCLLCNMLGLFPLLPNELTCTWRPKLSSAPTCWKAGTSLFRKRKWVKPICSCDFCNWFVFSWPFPDLSFHFEHFFPWNSFDWAQMLHVETQIKLQPKHCNLVFIVVTLRVTLGTMSPWMIEPAKVMKYFNSLLLQKALSVWMQPLGMLSSWFALACATGGRAREEGDWDEWWRPMSGITGGKSA